MLACLNDTGSGLVLDDEQEISFKHCLGCLTTGADSATLRWLDEDAVSEVQLQFRSGALRALQEATSRPFGLIPGATARPRVQVLLNPFAGTGNSAKCKAQVDSILRAPGLDVQFIETEYAGHAWRLGRDQDLTDVVAVIMISGDGLLHEFINGLMTREPALPLQNMPALGIIPAGSGNGLAKSLTHSCGLPLEPWACAYIAVKGASTPLDLQRYRVPGSVAMGLECGSPAEWRYSFLSLTWALIADIDIESERCRCAGGLRFPLEAILKICRNRTYNGTLHYRTRDKGGAWQTSEGPFSVFLASNVTHISNDLQLTPEAGFETRSVDIVFVRDVGRCALLKLFMDTESGEIAEDPLVHNLTGVEAFRLVPEDEYEDGHMVIDGEEVPYDAIECVVMPGALRILTLSDFLGID